MDVVLRRFVFLLKSSQVTVLPNTFSIMCVEFS